MENLEHRQISENMENMENIINIENTNICMVWWAMCPQTYVYVTFGEPLLFKLMYF